MYPCIWNLKSKAYKETGGKGGRESQKISAINRKYDCKCIKAI